jgi:hypothetical protein
MQINLVSERNDGQKERSARKGSQNRPSLKLVSQVSLITGRNVKNTRAKSCSRGRRVLLAQLRGYGQSHLGMRLNRFAQ